MGTVGYNPDEPMGSSLGNEATIRISDPISGVGRFNANLDPNIVGIDAQTGTASPVGTDMSFSAAIRRQIMTGVINGDFSEFPPSGPYLSTGDPLPYYIVSDPTSAAYNPLPGWTWTPNADGLTVAYIQDAATYASDFKLKIVAGGAAGSTLDQLVAVPRSQGQQYRVLLSVFGGGVTTFLRYQYLHGDAVTTIGSEVSTATVSAAETRVDAGLVPPQAAYVRVRLYTGASVSTDFGEVRCAFSPSENTLGLYSRSAATSGITTTETRVAGITVPADSFTVGSTYRVTAYGVITSSAANAVTFRIRCGPTTLTGNIAGTRSPTATTTAAADGFKVEGLFTVRSVGVGGTCIANLEHVSSAAQPFTQPTTMSSTTGTVVVDTTVANQLELTAVAAAGTTTVTFHQALIECVMAS